MNWTTHFGTTLGFILGMLARVLIHGCVLFVLWQWFIVGQFSVAPLSYSTSAGICLVAYLFQVSRGAEKKKNLSGDNKVAARITLDTLVITPLVILCVGSIVKYIF